MSKHKIHVDGSGVVSFGEDTFVCASVHQARFLAAILGRVHDAGYIEGRNDRPQWKWGWLRNKHSVWMGVHYSEHNKRWCINLIPCVTFWITRPGGKTP